jgi:hypothetical protein
MNKKFYHDSGISIILNQQSKNDLQKNLESKKCKKCGGKLFIYISIDSSCVCCVNDMYHNTGFGIDMDFPKFELKPKIFGD